jgi:hypothetical protein
MEPPQRLVDIIVVELELVKERPGIYFGSEDNVGSALMFISGFGHACGALGLSPGFGVHRAVLERHGYGGQPDAIWFQMRERGIDGKGVVQEFIAMEIEKWRMYKEELGDSGG